MLQDHAKSDKQRHFALLTTVDVWECEDCRMIVHHTSKLEEGETADARALNQAITQARWTLKHQERYISALRSRGSCFKRN